jgi:hypothetical protein
VPPIAHGAIAAGSLVAPTFFARAEASSFAFFGFSDTDSAMVSFQRPFTLPPGGPYILTLTAIAAGILDVTDVTSGRATVSASVAYGPPGAPAFLVIDSFVNPLFSLADPPTPNGAYNTGPTTLAVLPIPPGNYEIRGSLSANSLVTLAGVFGDTSTSNYLFASELGFMGSGEFFPIPEPSTIMLFCTGLLTVVAFKTRRRGGRNTL